MARPRSTLGDIRTSPRNVRLLKWLRRKPTPHKVVGETDDGEEVRAVVGAPSPAQWTDVLSIVRKCTKLQALDKDDNVLRQLELDGDDPELRAETETEAALAGLVRAQPSAASVPIISVDIPRLVDNIARNMREVASEAARQQSGAFKEGFTAMTSVVNICLKLLVGVEERLAAAEEQLTLQASNGQQGEGESGSDQRSQLAMLALQKAMGGGGNGASPKMDPAALMQLVQMLQTQGAAPTSGDGHAD